MRLPGDCFCAIMLSLLIEESHISDKITL